MTLIPSLLIVPVIYAASQSKGRTLPVPNDILTPPNQAPVNSLSRSQIASGLELPKNLIIPPSCSSGGGSSSSSSSGGCPPIVGTNGPDIIIATGSCKCYYLWH